MSVRTWVLRLALILCWTPLPASESLSLTPDKVAPDAGRFSLHGAWRYFIGDHPQGADPALDDSDWAQGSTGLGPNDSLRAKWTGQGWFRLRLDVDEALWGKTLGLDMDQNGASEIYLNGALLYRFGEVGLDRQSERGMLVPMTQAIVFPPQRQQLIAVRYSNFTLRESAKFGEVFGGFALRLGDYNDMWARRLDRERHFFGLFTNFAVMFGIVALLHFFLYCFSPQFPINAIFAGLTASMGGYTYWAVRVFQTDNLADALAVQALDSWIGVLIYIFLLLFVYTLFYDKRPRHFWAIAAIAALATLFDSLVPDWLSAAVNILLYGEILRVCIVAFVQKKKGSRVVGASLLILLMSVALQMMRDVSWVQPILRAMSISAPFYGVLALAIAMSIYLSREFAIANRSLALQLVEVRKLGDELLEKERREKEQEIERRLLEVENQRKTRELEEARQFQLSLLPKTLPQAPHFRFGAFMKTAAEVGGDFYDFQEAADGRLTVAIGDATGHGAKAGAMVAAVKGMFTLLADERDIPIFFRDVNRSIRQMNMPRMFMAMTLVKIKGTSVLLSAAGMPPAYIYRAESGELEEVAIKALPLGGVPFPYSQERFEMGSGDTLLLLSDGLPELFNERREMFDYGRVKTVFQGSASKEPEDIIADLDQAATDWRQDHPQDDDITFVVIKAA